MIYKMSLYINSATLFSTRIRRIRTEEFARSSQTSSKIRIPLVRHRWSAACLCFNNTYIIFRFHLYVLNLQCLNNISANLSAFCTKNSLWCLLSAEKSESPWRYHQRASAMTKISELVVSMPLNWRVKLVSEIQLLQIATWHTHVRGIGVS